MMVAPALIAASYSIPGTPEYWRELPPESAALLIEYRSRRSGGPRRHGGGPLEALAGRETIRAAPTSRATRS